MLDPSFTKRTLKGQLKYRDFVKSSPPLIGPALEAAVEKALGIVANGFDDRLSIRTRQLHGKNIFSLTDISEQLVARKISKNIGRLTGSSQSDRNTIISNLQGFLEENISYRIYKLDIANFYETVDVVSLLERLRKDTAVSRPTVSLIHSLFQSLGAHSVIGLPRGLSISATLSELAMKQFDKNTKGLSEVFFFNRFVDDIIIVTSGNEHSEDFVSKIKKMLPDELNINKKKTQINHVKYEKDCSGKYRCKFDYLGYEFVVKNPNAKGLGRDVILDIAEKKAKKIKTRLVKSMINFSKNKDIDLLKKRVKFLTSNHTIFDPDTSSLRLAGIFYNYRYVSGSKSERLLNLDVFLKSLVLAGKTKVSYKSGLILTKKQKRDLLKMTFSKGFESRVIYNYSSEEVEKITECWKYE